jgi:homoserine dehydrogenase
VLAWAELSALAEEQKTSLEFSATVCGGLPVVNVGRRDLTCARIELLEGVFNSTTNYILDRMSHGEDRATALQAAQEAGIAEADPTLDLEGIDTANKLVILCNSVLEYPTQLSDVTITGISGVTADDVAGASLFDLVYRLVARARRHEDGSYSLSVNPEAVKKTSFIGSCVGSDMCCMFQSDEFERIMMKSDEKGVFPTACAMLRDIFTVQRQQKQAV